MAKYVKLCVNPQHSVKGPRGAECPACQVREDRATTEWLDYARTDHVVLLQRIKDAYFEGFEYASTGDFSLEKAWEDSESKRVHDTLKQLWSSQ